MEQPNKNIKLVSKKNTRVILPNILTLIGVCIGLSSIKFAFDGKFELSIIAVIIAGIIDGLDGRIARLIKGTSKVGKELDSLTDVISFGVAPAFIMYFWALSEMGRLGWFIALIYVVCVALRLARFNVSSEEESSWRDNFFIPVARKSFKTLSERGVLAVNIFDPQIKGKRYRTCDELCTDSYLHPYFKRNVLWII